MNWRRRVAAGLALSVGASAATASAAKAEDFTVENKDDNGTGSLRAAMDDANTMPGADRILFNASVTGTISIVNSLPKITDPVSIVGPGKDTLKLDGRGQARIFKADEANLSISGLTITGGSNYLGGDVSVEDADLSVIGSRISYGYSGQGAGGIFLEDGHLTLTDSEVTDNNGRTTGGALVIGSATISGSTISGNRGQGGPSLTRSGGLYMYLVDAGVESTVTDTLVSGNTAPSASGMLVRASHGDLTIDSSLFTGNEAAGGGTVLLGNLILGDLGSGTYAISNSTIAGNIAGAGTAGLLAFSDDITVESSTVTGNRVTGTPTPGSISGAGIAQTGGQMDLRNSIVSGNSPDDLWTSPQAGGVAAGAIQGSFNLTGQTTGVNFVETVPGSNIVSAAPQLGPLADNGGPTATMLPAATSPAVNKGSSALTTDARDLVRPVDFSSIPFSAAAGANGADIGAVELQGGPLPPPPNPTCETDPALCPVVKPSNEFTFGKVKLNRKKGVATLQVKVPGAGKVLLLGSKTVKGQSKSARGKTTVNLIVRAKGRAAKALKKKGKAKVKASVRFTPIGGTAKTQSKSVKLAKAKKKKK